MEFRTMKRKRQQLSDEESIGILQKATSGTLALLGDEGYPYAVPVSYVNLYPERHSHSKKSLNILAFCSLIRTFAADLSNIH